MFFVNISIGTNDSFLLNETASRLKDELPFFDYINFDSSDLDSNPVLLHEAMRIVAESDFVTIKVHGDPSFMKKFDRLEEAIRSNGVSALLCCTDEEVTTDYRWMFGGTDEEFDLALTYFSLGGDDNYRSLMLWAIRRCEGTDLEIPTPVVPPAQGVYYPGREDISFETFLDGLDRSKPVVGIFFYQKQWLTRNLDNIDGLIRAVEARGGSPVPVFLRTYEDPASGSIGVKRLLREKLSDGSGPVLDVIIETMSFSQTLVATPGCGEQVCDDNFFASYGVPVIQTMTTASDAETWRDDVYGLTPAEIAYDVAHPEFDGQIISVPSASTERLDDIRVYKSLPDRADRIADTAVLWGRLRRKPNPERRVAVLLYMYPPKTANAGGASGLDTFASVVDLLHRMRDEGYHLGDCIPDDPRELVDELLSGLTNDTTWLSDDDVRRRTVDRIPPEDYDRWYRALSENARTRIEEGWGAPPGEIGTVDGSITVAGKVFGNIIVGFQPDRGRDVRPTTMTRTP